MSASKDEAVRLRCEGLLVQASKALAAALVGSRQQAPPAVAVTAATGDAPPPHVEALDAAISALTFNKTLQCPAAHDLVPMDDPFAGNRFCDLCRGRYNDQRQQAGGKTTWLWCQQCKYDVCGFHCPKLPPPSSSSTSGDSPGSNGGAPRACAEAVASVGMPLPFVLVQLALVRPAPAPAPPTEPEGGDFGLGGGAGPDDGAKGGRMESTDAAYLSILLLKQLDADLEHPPHLSEALSETAVGLTAELQAFGGGGSGGGGGDGGVDLKHILRLCSVMLQTRLPVAGSSVKEPLAPTGAEAGAAGTVGGDGESGRDSSSNWIAGMLQAALVAMTAGNADSTAVDRLSSFLQGMDVELLVIHGAYAAAHKQLLIPGCVGAGRAALLSLLLRASASAAAEGQSEVMESLIGHLEQEPADCFKELSHEPCKALRCGECVEGSANKSNYGSAIPCVLDGACCVSARCGNLLCHHDNQRFLAKQRKKACHPSLQPCLHTYSPLLGLPPCTTSSSPMLGLALPLPQTKLCPFPPPHTSHSRTQLSRAFDSATQQRSQKLLIRATAAFSAALVAWDGTQSGAPNPSIALQALVKFGCVGWTGGKPGFQQCDVDVQCAQSIGSPGHALLPKLVELTGCPKGADRTAAFNSGWLLKQARGAG